MAAGPPYSKNVKKTEASEKLIKKRECGKARLMRGATIVENARTSRNPQLKVSCVRPTSANAKHTPPTRIMNPLA